MEYQIAKKSENNIIQKKLIPPDALKLGKNEDISPIFDPPWCP